MLALRRRTVHSTILALALGWGVAGCSSDESTAPGVNPAVVGTWNATSFVVPGPVDLIAQGMSLSFVLNSDGTYSFNITSDRGGLCDPGINDCTDSGTYTASDTQIILDAGTTDEATLNYSISGTTMTVNAVIEGTAVTIVLNKA